MFWGFRTSPNKAKPKKTKPQKLITVGFLVLDEIYAICSLVRQLVTKLKETQKEANSAAIKLENYLFVTKNIMLGPHTKVIGYFTATSIFHWAVIDQ